MELLALGKIASFRLGGKEYALIPAEMEREGETYSAVFDGVKAFFTPREFPDAVEWTVRLKNITGENTAQITDFFGMDVLFPCGGEKNVRWYGLKGDSCSEESFLPWEEALLPGEPFTLAPTLGRPSNTTAFPFFDFGWEGEHYAAALGWSGQWKCSFLREKDGLHVFGGQEDCDFYLEPGEEARSMRVLLYHNGQDAARTRYGLRERLRESFSPYTRLGDKMDPPVSVQIFDRYYWNNTEGYRCEDTQLRVIDLAGKTGNFNTFWIDAMWFKDAFPCGVGNYTFAEGFPNGLKRISDAVHQNGMRFMLWFEPERVDIGSDTYKAHGDGDGWLLDREDGDRNRLLNLGNPDTLRWITETLVDFIRDNGIDIYREDFNIDPLPYWRHNDAPGRKGITEMRFIEGFYALWDAIIAAYPDILIDNCSSGGRRLDLESLSRSISCWRSDSGCGIETEERKTSTWSQNQCAGLARYLPYQQSTSWFEKAYFIRSGLTDGMATGFEMMSDAYDPALAHDALAELYRLRPYWRGRYIPLEEVGLREDVWFAYELLLADRGCALAFRRGECPEEMYLLRLRDLEPEAEYTVTVTDEARQSQTFSATGKALMEGITLTSVGAKESFVVEFVRHR